MKQKLENLNSTAMEPFPQKANFDTQCEDIITLTSKKLLDDMRKLPSKCSEAGTTDQKPEDGK